MNTVLCSGVMRSASTWSYSVCRAIIGAAAAGYGLTVLSSYLEGEGLDDALKEIGDYPGVFKSHRFGEYAMRLIHTGLVKNVCTVRDPRECIASRQLFKDETLRESIDMVRGSFAPAMRFGSRTLYLDYRDIVADPEGQVRKVMRYLSFHTTQDAMFAKAVAEELSAEKMAERAPQTGVDPDYELHANHIHGNTDMSTLPEYATREVSAELAWYRRLFTTGDNHETSPVDRIPGSDDCGPNLGL